MSIYTTTTTNNNNNNNNSSSSSSSSYDYNNPDNSTKQSYNNQSYQSKDKTQQNSKCWLCDNRNETINHINECTKLPQKEYKTRRNWVGEGIHKKL